MKKIVIIADSTCDLTPEYVKENDVQILPMRINFKGDETDYYDGVNISGLEVYEKVKKVGSTPKTGAANIDELVRVFQPIIERGDDLIYIGIGSSMSSSYNNARLAAGEFPEGRIEVVDSQNLSTGIGLVVCKMVEFRNAGMNVHEIAEKARELVPLVSAKFCIDRLDYLYKGGRCSGMSLIVSKVLRIHPICKVINGKLTVYKKIMGNYRKAVVAQIEELKQDLENDNVDTSLVFVTDSQCMDGEDDYMIEEVGKLVGPEHVVHTHAGCTVSSHCGPKTIGVLYIKKRA